MKTKLLAMMLLAGGSMFAQTRVSIGVGFGGHGGAGFYQTPPSYAYASNIPPCPGPDYTWVDGYWSQDYGRNTWVAGYWNRLPFNSGYQVAPRFETRFNDGGNRRSSSRGFEQDRTRGSDQGRNFSGQNRNQNRGSGNQDQGGNRNHSDSRDNHQGNGYSNGFRGR
jgi:hypothetical protein